jgi:hypothetical protein
MMDQIQGRPLMKIALDREGSVDGLHRAVQQVMACAEVRSLLILCCDHNQFSPAQLDGWLQHLCVPVIGGIFPQLIYGQQCLRRGSLVIGFAQTMTIHTIQHLHDSQVDLTAQIQACQIRCDDPPVLSIVLFDALVSRLSTFMDGLFMHLGLDTSYIGGGAGSMSFEHQACLLSNAGMLQHAALIAQMKMTTGVGIAHGWQPLSTSMKVTQALGAQLISINYQPAFHVYQQILEAHTGQSIDAKNFLTFAQRYPLGIRKLDSDMIMRLPLALTEDGLGLLCSADIPEHAFVYIAQGPREQLLAAADIAQQRAQLSLDQGATAAARLVFDCVSRLAVFGDDIGTELQVLAAGQPMFGAFSMGEIANNGRDCLELYSMASAVACLSVSS